MSSRDAAPESAPPNGVPVAPGMQVNYARVYAAGRLDLRADGPPEHQAAIVDSLRWAVDIQINRTPDRFFERLVSNGVPPDVARGIVASLLLLDDETYISSRWGG